MAQIILATRIHDSSKSLVWATTIVSKHLYWATLELPLSAQALGEAALLTEGLAWAVARGVQEVVIRTANPLVHEAYFKLKLPGLTCRAELVDDDYIGLADTLCFEKYAAASGRNVSEPDDRALEVWRLALEWGTLSGDLPELAQLTGRDVRYPFELTASEAYKCLEHLPDNTVERVSISRAQRNELRRKIALAHFSNPLKLLGV